MKIIAYVLFFLPFIFTGLQAQETTTKIKKYRTWVFTDGGTGKIKGTLYEIRDSSVVMSQTIVIHKEAERIQADSHIISYDHIDVIKVRRQGQVGRWAGFGSVMGLVVGGMAGFISGDDPPGLFSMTAEEKALGAGIPLAILGGITGAAFGSKRIKIPINGNFSTFNSAKSKLNDYSVIK